MIIVVNKKNITILHTYLEYEGTKGTEKLYAHQTNPYAYIGNYEIKLNAKMKTP